MRSLLLATVLLGALGLTALIPSRADAFWFRPFAYSPAYNSYYYPAYTSGYGYYPYYSYSYSYSYPRSSYAYTPYRGTYYSSYPAYPPYSYRPAYSYYPTTYYYAYVP
jgi:hypothetical protein